MSVSVEHKFFRRVEEIDNLRALAVLGVVANHAAGLSGGFLGVDVFFVISGYVITLLLLKEVSQGDFSLGDFYHRRIARIIPPLLIVSIFIYLCARFIFWLPEDYGFIKQSFLYQATFAQNIFFAEKSADYFQGLTTAKLNLHFWSIAVEEQFYIIYPFLFLFAYSYRNNSWIRFFIFLVLIASLLLVTGFFEKYIVPVLGYIFQLLPQETSANGMRYYLLPTRAWELFLGATTCILAWRLHSKILSGGLRFSQSWVRALAASSLAVIVVSMVLINETMAWPNAATLFPVIATSILLTLITLFGASALPWYCSNSVFAAVGRSSYSLYLWHWPLLGVLIYTNSDYGRSALDYAFYLALVALFTSATYLAIEKTRRHISKWQSAIILLFFVGFSVYVGVEKRANDSFPDDVKLIIETSAYADKCNSCLQEPSGEFVILWGDSHSQMLVNVVEKSAAKNGLALVHIRGSLADQHVELLNLTRKPTYKGTILASRWSMYAVGFPPDEPEEKGDRYLVLNGKKATNSAEATEFFKAHLKRLLTALPENQPILIFKEVPRYPFMPQKEALMEWAGFRLRPLPVKSRQTHIDEQRTTSEIFSNVVSNFKNLQLIDPAELLCAKQGCIWRDGWNLLYKDDDHLSVYGAETFQAIFNDIMLDLEQKK